MQLWTMTLKTTSRKIFPYSSDKRKRCPFIQPLNSLLRSHPKLLLSSHKAGEITAILKMSEKKDSEPTPYHPTSIKEFLIHDVLDFPYCLSHFQLGLLFLATETDTLIVSLFLFSPYVNMIFLQKLPSLKSQIRVKQHTSAVSFEKETGHRYKYYPNHI